MTGEGIGGRIEVAWRDRAKIDALGTLGAGLLHYQMADAAEAAAPRFDHGERKGGGDGGINRAAARRQHLGADLGCGPVLSCDNTASRGGARLADLPILRQMHLAQPFM